MKPVGRSTSIHTSAFSSRQQPVVPLRVERLSGILRFLLAGGMLEILRLCSAGTRAPTMNQTRNGSRPIHFVMPGPLFVGRAASGCCAAALNLALGPTTAP
jgi:hypothetical protein